MFKDYIIKGIGGFYYVKTADGVVECKAKGIFRKKRITPVAGDFVTLAYTEGACTIAEILPRKNVFIRPPIANVDNFFIVASTVQPVPSTLVIDKLTAIALDKGVQPVLIITKTDLQNAEALAACYAHADIPIIYANAHSGEGLTEIKAHLAGKINVFCGNSGVGKSTLLGALLPNIIVETGTISKKLGRGRHTTREVQLYEAYGGLLADTPGFASLETVQASFIPKENLQFAFPDIERYFGQCKFTGCSHTVEKGCAVLAALQKGEIDVSRYNSYAAMYHEAKEAKEWEM